MVLLCWHPILLYAIHVVLILVRNFQEKIYQVNIFLTFATVQKIVRDQESKNKEQMASKISTKRDS